ncbi:uncharacterized protein BJ171DRAFT_63210 [Polychytrium aggregatum]|uniref:uncharacterized protein n=1 Tax=Polychytrium aggregatum TaxID=110093 RepID=UPI0022FEFC58|nr:uncharacterized protein BJ171DRAFT_63210 [Polychytrium aggregatum]KAI9205592.1 hypothetical protein BJ171DRAFT_63210 [Polychytrium aggregatum]
MDPWEGQSYVTVLGVIQDIHASIRFVLSSLPTPEAIQRLREILRESFDKCKSVSELMGPSSPDGPEPLDDGQTQVMSYVVDSLLVLLETSSVELDRCSDFVASLHSYISYADPIDRDNQTFFRHRLDESSGSSSSAGQSHSSTSYLPDQHRGGPHVHHHELQPRDPAAAGSMSPSPPNQSSRMTRHPPTRAASAYHQTGTGVCLPDRTDHPQHNPPDVALPPRAARALEQRRSSFDLSDDHSATAASHGRDHTDVPRQSMVEDSPSPQRTTGSVNQKTADDVAADAGPQAGWSEASLHRSFDRPARAVGDLGFRGGGSVGPDESRRGVWQGDAVFGRTCLRRLAFFWRGDRQQARFLAGAAQSTLVPS